MNNKTEELITKLEEKGIPFKLNMFEDGTFEIHSDVPLDDVFNEVGVINKNNVAPRDFIKDFNIEYRGLTNHEVDYEESLPYPLGADVILMRQLNDSVSDKITNIISNAVREATDELLSYLTECTAHISHSAKELAVSEVKEEMCRIVDREENYNGDNECCSTSGGGHCKCHR